MAVERFIPTGYRPRAVGTAMLWEDVDSASGRVCAAVQSVLEAALLALPWRLNYKPQGRLNFVCYRSCAHAHRALARELPPSFLLAPYRSPAESLVAFHSHELDSGNGEPGRMLRLFVHELAHVYAAERTGSTKCLGDDGAGLRLRSWVDEGFAVVMAESCGGRVHRLEAAVARARELDSWSAEDVDRALDALDSARRADAFAWATARVWRAVQAHGCARVFAELDQPEGWS